MLSIRLMLLEMLTPVKIFQKSTIDYQIHFGEAVSLSA